jgi:hypothetical protein
MEVFINFLQTALLILKFINDVLNVIRKIKVKKKNSIGEEEEYFGEVISYDTKTEKYNCVFDDGTPEKFFELLSINNVISTLINDEDKECESEDD